jgi:hypothetical protein
VAMASLLEYPLRWLRLRVASGEVQVVGASLMGGVYTGEPGSLSRLFSMAWGPRGLAPWRSGLGGIVFSVTPAGLSALGPQFQQTALGMAQGPSSVDAVASGVLPAGVGGSAAIDYLKDWQELKFEREVWRSLDSLGLGRRHWVERQHYYANFYSPSATVNKISTWVPNHLIPGWAFVTPYSSRLRYAALGKVDIALIVVFMAALGSVLSAVNYLITYRYIGAPTFKNRRELRSFFVDGLLIGSRMMLVANPALLIGIILLLSDRHLGTSIFDFSGGGDTVLFQHLFWFFGHPEVYIIIIPCFGFMNSLLPYYLRKRLSGRLSLQFSMYTIAIMSFAV